LQIWIELFLSDDEPLKVHQQGLTDFEAYANMGGNNPSKLA